MHVQDSDQARWLLVSLFLIIEVPMLLNSLAIGANQRPHRRRERMTFAQSFWGLLNQFTLLGVLAWAYQADLWRPLDFNLRFTMVLPALLVGGLTYAAFAAYGKHLVWPSQDMKAWISDSLQAQRALWPLSRVGKFFRVATLTINPVTEEMIMRGVFVRAMGLATHSTAVGVAFGLVLCVITHAYQGRAYIAYHITFFALTTMLMFSDFGLLAAITAHLGADLSPALRAKDSIRSIRQTRAALQAAQREGAQLHK